MARCANLVKDKKLTPIFEKYSSVPNREYLSIKGMSEHSHKLHGLKIDRSGGEGEDSEGAKIGKPVVFGALAVVILLTAFGLYTLFTTDEPAEPAATAQTAATSTGQGTSDPATQTQTALPPSREILNASGYITARRVATVSSEITGRVEEVLVEEGTVVEEGQVVARLDDTLAKVDLDLAKARVRSAEATIKSTQADLDEAKRVLARTEELVRQKNASEAALTKSQAAVDGLQSALDRAVAERDVAKFEVARQQETLDRYTIRAPFSGVVVDKNAQPGEMISPISAGGGYTRTGICTIVDMDSLEIEVDVSENYINRVFAGQEVTATLDSYPDWDIPASVIAVVPTANRDKATVRVRIALGLKDPRILPDMGVKVAFLSDNEDN